MNHDEDKNFFEKTNLYSEKDFWPAFMNDIRVTKNRLIIMSPFISGRRITLLEPVLRNLQSEGVNIVLYTRPPVTQGDSLCNSARVLIDRLLGYGIAICERKSMHQKVAIIDNNIVWEGSLNILSHYNTEEQMRRIQEPRIVQDVISKLRL